MAPILETLTTTKADGDLGSGEASMDEAISSVFSKMIMHAAQPNLRFLQVASIKRDLTVTPGNTITFVKFSDLAAGGTLTEGTPMVAAALAASQVEVTVGEHGKAVNVSELLLRQSFFDVMAEAAGALGRHAAIDIDSTIQTALDSGITQIQWADADGVTNDEDDDIVAADVFDTWVLKNAVEVLATNNTPKLVGPGGIPSYVCFAHPHQLRHLRDDAAWIDSKRYGAPSELWLGETGMYEDVRFIDTTQIAATANTGSVDVYKAFLVGAGSVAFAIGLDVEMRDNGVMDFGREHGLAWYGIFGSGVLEADYGVEIHSA